MSNRIKHYREKANLSLQQLADLVGLSSAGSVWQFERGMVSPSHETTIKLLAVFQCSFEDLFPIEAKHGQK